MVPVTVPRTWKSERAAFTWWIDDVMMDEGTRVKSQQQPPDSGIWNEQMQMVRLFDQLIANIDRNAGNLLIGKNWRGLGDRSHARVPDPEHPAVDRPTSPAAIARCSPRLKTLNRDVLKREIGDFVSDFQINALLARRDQIVALIEKAGPAGVFDRRR